MASTPPVNNFTYNINHHNQFSASPPAQPTSDGSDSRPPAGKHRRGYQACEPCRARKVACKLGDVDNPTAGKCERCKREMKDCVFAPTRKKVPRPSKDASGADTPNTVNKISPNAMKRRHSDVALDDNDTGYPQRRQPLHESSSYSNRPATNVSERFATPTTPHAMDFSASHMPRSAPQSYRRNVNIKVSATPQALSRVGGDGEYLVQSLVAAQALADPVSTTQHTMKTLLEAVDVVSADAATNITSPDTDTRRSRTYSSITAGGPTDVDASIRDTQPDAEIDQALELWSQMRFVKAGWFSPQEAINYIEFFYRELAQMTPVSIPDYRSPRMHFALLSEEPVLALALLTIASRQMPLQGRAAVSRSHEIHRQLWQALQGMVQRLLWGQEQFGGGFTGAGATSLRESITGQITWSGSLRTYGTIEALLLLTDWQPRALHFPPGGDDYDLIDQQSIRLAARGHFASSAIKDDTNNAGSSATAVLEPGWRSDRMSYMLLALTQALAYELGVMDNNHDDCGRSHGKDSDCLRKRRLRRLVLLYVTQTSGRLGIKSMLTPDQDPDEIFDNDPHHYSDNIDLMQSYWLGLATIMFSANKDVFSSKQCTKDLMSTGKYKDRIAELAPRLAKWKKDFGGVSSKFHSTMKHVLIMEYEYARMFINSVGFNKVVESWKEHGPKVDGTTLAQIAEENKLYISETQNAASSIVVNLLEGFASKDKLRNAAIRTYLRSFAAMVFTLKLFTLGNHETVIKESLRLLERIVTAMESQVVDDVHICTTIASQVKNFTAVVRNTMIRIRKPGNGSGRSSHNASKQHSPTQHQKFHSNNSVQQDPRYLAQPNMASPDDPLASIEARPMAAFSEETFMPPPGFGADGDMNTFDSNIDPMMSQFDFNNHDWLTLPLDNFLTDESGQVEPGMSGVGPILGGRDMLDWLDPNSASQTANNQWIGLPGNSHTNGYGGPNGY